MQNKKCGELKDSVMKRTAGDVLEVYEDSDGDDKEYEDFGEDEEKVEPTTSDTVTFQSEPKKKLKAGRLQKKLTKSQLSEKRKLAQDRKIFGLVRPDVTTNREKERLLKRIATKGVVQLFNAVAERQRVLAEELSKKMSAKERRETERRLQGSTFKVYPENESNGVNKVEPRESDEENSIKQESDVD
ncbi:hypothetical protein ANCCAN_01000 [Ancylostoma caninum]|uniref:RRP15-like protein n=1 Tax=Ancylostoma caninum TaxID=29170 RepID=A0A368H8S6_ANCCA|nr:hypothetical protein ANCCAN_01000 [Ancylostoma caninum]